MSKIYTKDGQIFKTPIKIEKEVEKLVKEKTEDGKEIEVLKKVKVCTYTNDEKLLTEAGYTEYILQPRVKTMEEKIADSVSRINAETDDKILNDFVFDGNEFYLTTENQTNFANLFVARDFLSYPQIVKTKTGFMELQKDEVSGFYIAGVSFIKTCLEEGWKRKAEAEAQIRAEYDENNNNTKVD